MSYTYKLAVSDKLDVWIGVCHHDPYMMPYDKGTMRPYHELSDKEWKFTGRYRFTENWAYTRLEVEVKYDVWVSVPRTATDWWDRLWNGSFTMERQDKTRWVHESDFVFDEKKPIYTYDCHCREPEVTYG